MNLINKLAELLGFHASYYSHFGEHVTANEDALSALLKAMGYDLSSAQHIEKSIADIEQQPWKDILPLTHIAKLEQSQHNIILSLPKQEKTTLFWQIVLEHGEKIQGEFSLSDLVAKHSQVINGDSYTQYQMPLPALVHGYHRLLVNYGDHHGDCHLIFAPKTCYSPTDVSTEKMWGFAAQLYALRSKNNFGIGDFGDLKSLIKYSADQGAAILGLNPLHPLYQNNPSHRSPYSPTSRCFLNVLYIDIRQVPFYQESTQVQAILENEKFIAEKLACQSSELIDYVEVAQLKFPLLALLYQTLIQHPTSEAWQAFTQYKTDNGAKLTTLTTFEALYEHFRGLDEHAYGWQTWPQAYQNPDSKEVHAFQQSHADRIDYFAFLQWQAHVQLSAAAQSAKDQQMPIGLYLDLAVGCDGSGVDVWSQQSAYVAGASVGAPPDALNTLGQDWGLTPLNPIALQALGFSPLIDALRSNMQYAGALRIDHIIGLMRQYWVAPGLNADQGVFISFPLDDIFRIIALESHRNQCIVIGEDLGTIPDGFGDLMADAGLLSYKVLFFERWESGLYKRPDAYPELAMVTVSTHDLPTLSSWWQGIDLQWRQKLNLYPTPEMGEQERAARLDERDYLIGALKDAQLLTPETAPILEPPTMNRALSVAVQQFLAQTPSLIQLIPLEDALESSEQVNIPGTVDEHPNWRKKMALTLEEYVQSSSMNDIAQAMRKCRPSNT